MPPAAPTPAAPAAAAAPAAPASPPEEVLLALLRHNLALVARSVAHLEPRFTARALRALTTTRRRVTAHPAVLATAVQESIAADDARAALLRLLPQAYTPMPVKTPTAPAAKESSDAMDVDAPAGDAKKPAKDTIAKSDSKAKDDKDAKAKEPAKPAAPVLDQPFKPSPEAAAELEAYMNLLVVVYLLDSGRVQEALPLARSALSAATAQNRRTLDQVAARLIFYLSRCVELAAKAGSGSGLAGERPFLISLHRTSTLRHDPETQATVINLLLRSYIGEANLLDQADKLVARAPFPRGKAGNGQIARYEYYVGRIRAVQLNYSEAHAHLQQAIRRAPSTTPAAGQAPAASGAAKAGAASKAAPTAGSGAISSSTAPAAGFLQTAYKFLVVVELLMGDIPDRSIFRTEVLKRALAPYMEIVQAVRVGDLSLFQKTLTTHDALFAADRTRSLILRLRHNVIKTGIRTISLAYSRISLHDITQKLHLESEEDAEYIVAKAVRDGVIEARVDHERGEMRSAETGDLYGTNEPQAQFRQRVNYCLQLHNESVKAMRYPLNNHKAELASAVAAREREREIANEIADGDVSDEDDDWV
ncbi:hypothetical protein FA09DRAFT_329279 [Tilletiopsis washingtonensis]|uniref:PCI domain-containing protein n=1 Tax=Tilletiopsis washingtonensis TaxID=58919 RepID=A0A316ZCN8_9BASI|nr:hypothetical protein FA09DRAFT_329279 [Tilletiopsis washingtonensis]PWN98784.1 hypothetical protein FA09DRAFT_329279 [Tilletiopsis washingtonensis]